MVVILQQTTDNGKRFVSTLVDEGPPSRMNRFSGVSPSGRSTVSERSAVYKQRIDSLFGNPKFQAPPKKATNPGGNWKKLENTGKTIFLPKVFPFSNMTTSEDEGYQRIDDDLEQGSSLVLDSLVQKSSSSSPRNVSTVTLNTESSSDQEKPRGGKGEGLPWRYRTYCNMNTTNFTTDLQRQLEKAHGSSSQPPNSSGILQFPVQYLGSVQIQGSTASLQDLQCPLRTLYLNFLRASGLTPGQLSINREGLHFESPRLRILNPFSNISVWAAIKFVARGEPVPSEFAFMPLISDPEGQDKRRLFGKMDADLVNAYVPSSTNLEFRNPPLFAFVTCDTNGQHQSASECHAFTCKCAEDAIVVAANLYQYLLVNELKTNKEGESGYGSLTHSSPIATNQNSPTSRDDAVRPFSSASSGLSPTDETTSGCGSISFAHTKTNQKPCVTFSDVDPHARPPPRPPRRNNGEISTKSGYISDESASLLKIPLQRKRSFKTSYNRYQRTTPGKVKKRVKISAPEKSPSDEAVERILEKMLKQGRSLDDLKPSYKKLILRLALILTQGHRQKKGKGELKRQQQRFSVRSKKSLAKNDASEEIPPQLGCVFKPFSKMTVVRGGANPRRISTEKPMLNPLVNSVKGHMPMSVRKCGGDDHILSICSGCLCDNCSEKCYCSLPMKQDRKSVSSTSVTPSVVSTCRVKDTESVKSSKKSESVQKKGKGCGYDTESCAESEKCYCSLQRVKSNGLKIYNINLDTETSDTDTNSYDLEASKLRGTMKVQYDSSRSQLSPTVKMLRYNPGRRSSSGSPSQQPTALVYLPQSRSPGIRGNANPPSAIRMAVKNDTQHGRGSPSRRQRKKVLLLSDSNSSHEDLTSSSDCQPRSRKPANGFHSAHASRRPLGDISEDDDAFVCPEPTKDACACDDSLDSIQVLDMKKTAEIEAMFTTLQISEGGKSSNDQLPLRRKSSSKTVRYSSASVDFQTSLGYLP